MSWKSEHGIRNQSVPSLGQTMYDVFKMENKLKKRIVNQIHKCQN